MSMRDSCDRLEELDKDTAVTDVLLVHTIVNSSRLLWQLTWHSPFCRPSFARVYRIGVFRLDFTVIGSSHCDGN